MIAFVVALLLAAAEPQPAASPAKGRGLAEAYCEGCHAVGPRGDSPRAAAPPFRQLHLRYPVESLQESLAEGIMAGHPEMPEFIFFPRDIDDFVAYLKSLEPAQSAAPPRP